MSITTQQAQELLSGSATVYSASGERIGKIGQVYADDETNAPSWVTIETGLFGLKTTFAPLEGARIDGEGLHLRFEEETVKDAPRIDPDGTLTPAEEEQLYRHYGLGEFAVETKTGGTPDRGDDVDAPADRRGVRLRKYVRTDSNPDELSPDAPPGRT
jgi:hypothetical protein